MSEPNLKQTVEERARAVADPLVAAEGFELLDLEFVREREGWILRMFIDKPGAGPGTGGVGLEDCSTVSRALDPAFDVEDFIPHEYSLEVSSPGLNRPLKKPHHYERVLGQRVKVKTFGPIGDPPRKNFTGKLTAATAEQITVEVDGAGAFQLPLKDIAKANLEFDFSASLSASKRASKQPSKTPSKNTDRQ